MVRDQAAIQAKRRATLLAKNTERAKEACQQAGIELVGVIDAKHISVNCKLCSAEHEVELHYLEKGQRLLCEPCAYVDSLAF
jgi:transposase-like protein